MKRIAKICIGLGIILAVMVAIPTGWMPAVVEVTVTNSGVDVVYNESAVSAILDLGDSEQTKTAEPQPTTTESTGRSANDGSRGDRTESLIHDRINDVRSEHGLSELDRAPELDEVAQYHSDDMAEREYFSHTSPEGESLRDRYDKFGIGCPGGENIFKYRSSFGASSETVANQAVEGWMDSPGHRENILRPRFSKEGIGVTFSGDEVYVTQNFC